MTTLTGKMKEIGKQLIKAKNRDLERLGSLQFDRLWAAVRLDLERMIGDGKATPPLLVVRFDDDTYETVILMGFEPNSRRQIVMEALPLFCKQLGDRRAVGAAVVSEAYLVTQLIGGDEVYPKEAREKNLLGAGKVAGSEEIMLVAVFDGLVGTAEIHTAPILRKEGERPALGEWQSSSAGLQAGDEKEGWKLGGGLIEGLAMGLVLNNLALLGVTPENFKDFAPLEDAN